MRLYGHYLDIHLKAAMQHKKSFLFTMIGQFLVSFNVFLGIYYMFKRFGKVADYSYSEVLLCFSINLMAYGIAEMFFRGFDQFASIIANGEFDRILVRPKSVVFQVLASKAEFTRIGRMLQAVIMFWYGITHASIEWDLKKVVTVVFMLAGGATLFAGIYLVYASFCFFTLEGLEFMNIFTDGAREYGKYPVSVYGKTVQTICTYFVPYALFQYYPFLYLLGKRESDWYIVLPLLAGIFILPCYLLFRYGISHYKSTGS